jgi:hypothetical protein
MYNCKYFSDTRLTNNKGVSVNVDGICTNIITYRNTQSLGGNSNIELTYDNSPYLTSRRSAVCKRSKNTGFCVAENREINTKLGFNLPLTGWTSCDEFPFATTEQGGGEVGETAQLCVPTSQQDIQSKCNDLVTNLETNVNANVDGTPIDANKGENWIAWDSGYETWTPAEGSTPPPWQTTITGYSPDGPLSYGIPEKSPDGTSWKWKRNYVFKTIDTSPPASMAFPDHAFSSGTWWSGGITPITSNDVICAISRNDAKRVRLRSGRFNAYCNVNPNRAARTFGNWANTARYSACVVQFSGIQNRKRDLGLEDIIDIKLVGQVYDAEGRPIMAPRDVDIGSDDEPNKESDLDQSPRRVTFLNSNAGPHTSSKVL